MNNGMIIF